MVFLWLSYGLPTIFLWFFYVFPTITMATCPSNGSAVLSPRPLGGSGRRSRAAWAGAVPPWRRLWALRQLHTEIRYSKDMYVCISIYLYVYIYVYIYGLYIYIYIYICLCIINIYIYILYIIYYIYYYIYIYMPGQIKKKSPTGNKAIWGWFPLLIIIYGEVVVRSLYFAQIYIYIYVCVCIYIYV